MKGDSTPSPKDFMEHKVPTTPEETRRMRNTAVGIRKVREEDWVPDNRYGKVLTSNYAV